MAVNRKKLGVSLRAKLLRHYSSKRRKLIVAENDEPVSYKKLYRAFFSYKNYFGAYHSFTVTGKAFDRGLFRNSAVLRQTC